MLISDEIAKLIEEMLDSGDGTAEIKRNDLAGRIGCVPSQINYVITSRFTSNGYIIESRRGGGGYIKIVRKQMSKNEYLMHFFQAVGEEIDNKTARQFLSNLKDREIISERESAIVYNIFKHIDSNTDRADLMRSVLLTVMD